MPSSSQRHELARALGAHLSAFEPSLSGKFQCPACRSVIDIEKRPAEISAAHIIPEAAGGRLWTLLCRSCNSYFGRFQDKWFGEYLEVTLNPEGTFMHAKTKSRYITVNDEKVSSRVGISDDGGLEVLLPRNHNPPGKVENLELEETVTITFEPEVVKHQQEITVGYLTAAYLLWFATMGYNWANQSSLNGVREQLLNPVEPVCNDFELIAFSYDQMLDPRIAILPVGGYAYAAAAIYDRLVVFPPAPNSNIPKFDNRKLISGEYELITPKLGLLRDPYIMSLDDSIVIWPDMIRADPPIPKYILKLSANIEEPAHWLVLQNH